MPPVSDRRTRIADAVITLLAEQGSRGLTHRAVDAQAGLPKGSTSYYFRSRAELLGAAAPRLAELDIALVDQGGNDPASFMGHILDESLSGVGRIRTLARYELMLEAARRPEIHAALTAGTNRFRDKLTSLFPLADPQEARLLAGDVIAYLDGLFLSNITSPQMQRQSAVELKCRLARFIDLGVETSHE